MSYLQLNKRQKTGEVIAFHLTAKNEPIKLIKLDKPYADGTSYAVHEETKNAFCSNGLFITEKAARAKYDLMIKNSES